MGHHAGMYGIPTMYINIIRDLYDQNSSCILEGTRTADWFDVKILNYVAKSMAISINPSKTKTMRLNGRKSDPITVGGSKVEDVEAFTYLGAVLEKQGSPEADIKRRLPLARNAFATLQLLWNPRTKMPIFNTNLVNVLLYGAEIWRTTAADRNKLEAFHRKCMRKILRVFWPNQISNEKLYSRTNTLPLSVKIKLHLRKTKTDRRLF